MMERLRRERNRLRDELASSSAARDEALAQVEAVQLELGKAMSSKGGGAALAEAQRKVQALTEAVGVYEQHASNSDAAIEATAERGRRRLERSKKRESELEAVVLKAQEQRDAATEELGVARTAALNLQQELASARSHYAVAMAAADAEIDRLTALVEELRESGGAKAPPPAAAVEPSSEVDENDENSDVESAGAMSAVDGESGDDADEGSDDGGERAYQEATTSATDQLAKKDPELADMVKKIDARGRDLTYRMAHGRGVGEESSSDDDTGAARALAQGGAKSLQLGDKQHKRLSRRLSQHEQASAPRQVPVSANVAPPTPPTPAISRSTPAADDELTLGGPTVATPTLARIGPHAALSGIAQRATTLALGGVRSLVGRSDDGSPAESFVDVGGAESSRSLDRHDCSGRGFPTPTVVAGGGAPVETPPAPQRARAELDLELTMPFFNDPVIQATAVNGWGPQWGSPQASGVRWVVPSLPGASPPPAGMHDTRAGVESGGLADGGEVSLQQRQVRASEIRAAAAVKANEIQLSKIRNDDDKLEKDSDKYDSNDFKILRMIVNDFSASYTPPVAHDPKPSADTRTLTSKWVETVTDRVKDPIIRAREYDIMFVPTRRIIKLTARVRFGREGLHPDMFRAYSWTNTRTMAPLTHDKSKLEAKLQASDLASELHDYSERSEQMVHWVRQTLSKNFADRLEAFFAWGETKLKKDKEGLWTLMD